MAARASSPRFPLDPLQTVQVDREQCSCDMALDGEVGQAYNEEAFRYFLEIERKRSEGSNHPLLLLLVALKSEPGAEELIAPGVAARLFAGLVVCLRETDFAGWYRENRVLGAVLTQRAAAPRAEVSAEISQRVSARLNRQVSASIARRIQLRVFRLPSLSEDFRHE
jgi:hypothetical protein